MTGDVAKQMTGTTPPISGSALERAAWSPGPSLTGTLLVPTVPPRVDHLTPRGGGQQAREAHGCG
ncbi:MAG: hypothetical protein AB7V43_03440 [Acidimicrobiia bacterium]